MGRFLVPVVVLGAAFAADGLNLGESLAPRLLSNVSRGLFAVVFLLAWRFRRGRVAYAVVAVAAAAEAFHRSLAGGEVLPAAGEVLPAALAVLLPVNLAVLSFLHEWRVASAGGAIRLAVLASQAAAVAALSQPWMAAVAVRTALVSPLVASERLDAFLPWPQAGALAIVLAAAALCGRIAWRPSPLEAGFLGALAATAAGIATDRTWYYLAAAGLILGLSLIENAFFLAFVDGLTHLPARRALEETLVQLRRVYTLAMVDLDHFKKFNDRHGHEVGDQVLQMVAAQLARVGGGGEAFRYGGEEFSVVFAGKTAKEAEGVLDELRKTIAGTSFTVRSPTRPEKKPKNGRKSAAGTKELRVTVSIGAAERSEKNPTPELVLKAADKALYRSKKAGRNRVTIGK